MNKERKKCIKEMMEFYDPLDDNRLTLDYIFKYANDGELSAIIHSIIDRINDRLKESYYEGGSDVKRIPISDKEIHEIVMGLRKPQ